MIDQYTMQSALKSKNDFYVDETRGDVGPHVRWNSNDRVPFDDMLEAFQTLGWIDSQTRKNSAVARDADIDAVLKEGK